MKYKLNLTAKLDMRKKDILQCTSPEELIGHPTYIYPVLLDWETSIAANENFSIWKKNTISNNEIIEADSIETCTSKICENEGCRRKLIMWEGEGYCLEHFTEVLPEVEPEAKWRMIRI